MLIPPLIFGGLWLGLCYWVSGNRWGRRIVSALAAAAFLGFFFMLLADRLLLPQLEARNDVPRNSVTVQLQFLGIGALCGAAVGPLLARLTLTYWVLNVVVVGTYILLPWMPFSH